MIINIFFLNTLVIRSIYAYQLNRFAKGDARRNYRIGDGSLVFGCNNLITAYSSLLLILVVNYIFWTTLKWLFLWADFFYDFCVFLCKCIPSFVNHLSGGKPVADLDQLFILYSALSSKTRQGICNWKNW